MSARSRAWTHEQDEILLDARSRAFDKGWGWEKVPSIFEKLGGIQRTPGALQQRFSVLSCQAKARERKRESTPPRILPVLLRYVQDGVRLKVKTKEQAYDELVQLLERHLRVAA